MSGTDIFATLCALLPAQFEALIERAEVPPEFLSPPNVAQATRATELVRWMKQKPAQRRRVLAGLAKVQGEPEPAPTHSAPSTADPRAPTAARTAAPSRAARTVLFLAAEPLDAVRLRLGAELETIRERLSVPIDRGDLVLESRWAVSPRKLNLVLMKVKPNVVHFSGHGSRRGRLYLEGEDGQAVEVTPAAVERVLRLVQDLECVVLNACYAESQAAMLARFVPYVVGLRNEIEDDASIAYAEGFYAALAEGRSIEGAHAAGCAQLGMLEFPEEMAPILTTRQVQLHAWERDYLSNRREAWERARHGPLAAQGLDVGRADLYVPLYAAPQPWCFVDKQGSLVVRPGEQARSEEGPGGGAHAEHVAARSDGMNPPLAEQATTHAALPFVVIQGEAGSGKTVLLQHLAYVLASKHLDLPLRQPHRLDLEALHSGAPLLRVPVWVEARRIAEAATLRPEGALVRAVGQAFGDVARVEEQTVLDGLRAGRYLLLIDALDEVPTVEARQQVLEALTGLLAMGWPCRVVLSARPTAHTGARLPARLPVLELAPLDPPQVERLAARWCAARGRPDREARALTQAVEAVRERHAAEGLVENPMLLTALFLVHDQEQQRLPESTATLYERMVDVLCKAKPPAPFTDEGERRCTARERREALELVLHGLQCAGGTERAVDQVAEDLAEWKPAELPRVGQAKFFLSRLADDTGLLRFEERRDAQDRPDIVVRPWHRTFQEYLSACVLANEAARVEDVAATTDRLFAPRDGHAPVVDDPAWTGVLDFLVGAHGQRGGGTERARACVARLYAHASGEHEARVLALVATALVEYEQYFRGHGLARDLPGEIVSRFEARGASWPWRDRVLALEALEALGRLGDPRLRREPWVEIAGGVLKMGGDRKAYNSAPPHKVTVASFRLSRWPVTVEQYREFVDAGGYSERGWWVVEPPSEGEPADWRQQVRHPNRPVVGVNWHEAMAWCRWASAHRVPAGHYITLPTEEEWEFAARGEEGREFPWGSAEPGGDDQARANWRWGESGPGRPTPVGAFPRGNCGELWDVAGNVWEWTASAWRDPKVPVGEWPTTGCQEGDTVCRQGDIDCRDDDKACREGDTVRVAHRFQSDEVGESTSAAPRVVRGGSWVSETGSLRCAARGRWHPEDRGPSLGFRVVCRRFRQHATIGS